MGLIGSKKTCIIIFLVLLAATAPAICQSPVTIPEFPEDYQKPPDVRAETRSVSAEWEDFLRGDLFAMCVLIVSLTLAAVLVLNIRSRRWIFVLLLTDLIYFGFIHRGCLCPIGAIQNISAAIFDPTYIIGYVTLVIFLLPLVFALFAGRVFCGSICPLGAIQDIVGIYPLKVPRWIEESLGLLPWLYLTLAVLFAAMGAGFIICRYDPFIAIFRIAGSLDMLILGACVLLISLFIARPYCRFICPYSPLLRACSSVSQKHARITLADCITCKLCEDACPYGAILAPTDTSAKSSRLKGKAALIILLITCPIIIAIGSLAGYLASDTLSRMHPTINLAERIDYERDNFTNPETNRISLKNMTDASEAFRETNESPANLSRRALDIKSRFDIASVAAGWFIGMIISLKLIQLATRRKRTIYQPNKSTCLSCGRCFNHCPTSNRSSANPTSQPTPPAHDADEKCCPADNKSFDNPANQQADKNAEGLL